MRLSPLVAAVDQAMRGFSGPASGEALVVGLSGGADSTALLDALAWLAKRQAFRVVAAHLDHGLRPGSGADAAFCAVVCDRLGVALETGRADVRARARREGGGTEEAARGARYAFLRKVKRARGACAVAVAHTLDDQAETFLLRLLRGAGSAGLGAMRAVSGDVLRPMLEVTRQDVLAHLRSRGLEWREDESNADPAFLRNRTRHELLPYLEARFNPKVRRALARTASVLAEEAEALALEGDALCRREGRRDGDAVVLSRAALADVSRAVARAAVRSALAQAGGLRGVGLAHVDRILAIAQAPSPSGKRLPLPGAREAVFEFGELRLGPRRAPAPTFAIDLPVPGRVTLPGGLSLEARAAGGPAVSNGEMAVVAAPNGPLMVRTRRPGDRVRAKGRDMSLKKFLMERRVPADERVGLPLLAAGSHVLWVPGQDLESAADARRYVRVRLEKER